MLSNNLEQTLKRALLLATDYKHEYATYEHLLLALLEDIDAQQALVENEVIIEPLRLKLINYLKSELTDLQNNNAQDAKPTAGFQRIIQRAALHSQASGQRIITGAHVLTEFFFEHEAYALLCLKEANLTRHNILNYIKKLDTTGMHHSPENDAAQISIIENMAHNSLKTSAKARINDEESEHLNELEKYCINLNERAGSDSIDCLIGRQNEIQRTIEILCRRKKNNAILVGEPGVGKTAIAEGLAIRIMKKDVPDLLKDMVIYALDIGSLVAGTKFRGDFEERIKNLLEFFKHNKNAILFIDEIHTIIGAGSTTSGGLDASNLLKPVLTKGELRCIGSTTFREYHNHFEKDMALVRRFQKVIVTEPDEATSLEILQGLKGYYEKHHNVIYTDSALKAAVQLSERYINDRHLPDKAIDLIDEAGARSKTEKNTKKPVTITEKNIEEILSTILDIPSTSFESDDRIQLKKLSQNLKNCIFGQDEAIENLCASIRLSKAGLRKVTRPTGCYLFTGPTGVGKTELAKQLAKYCNMKLLKFDMSEFSESSSISKLLGSAPGYVGFEQGGMLTEEVSKHPYSVVLLDEIEKAHPDINSLLLQIMDEGKLTDSTGKQVNFTHSMIILTSNIVAEAGRVAIGFSEMDTASTPMLVNMDKINEQFSPELRSRLDNIIVFNPINKIVGQIVSKNLKELASQLACKKVQLTVSSSVKTYFSTSYLNSSNGARELAKIIDNSIKQAIADEILFGKLKHGGVVNVDFSKSDQKLTFKFSGLKKDAKNQLETS